MKFTLKLQSEKIPGIKSIRKLPEDQEKFKSYGNLFLAKYFLDDGKDPKMIAFACKSKSFSKDVLLVLFDLKLRPALFFEMKPEVNKKEFLNFLGKLISTSKFTIPKRKIKNEVHIISLQNKLKESFDIDDQINIMTTLSAILSGITILVSVVMIAQYYFTKVKHAAEEYYVNTTVEVELNNSLFKGQEKNESGFEMFVDLEQQILMVLNKKINAIILCGPPGMSKTYMVRRTLHFNKATPGKDYIIEKGSSLGLTSTYQLLYENRNKLLILDDFDTPLRDPEIVNLLKATTDTYGKRIVSLAREKMVSTQSQSTSAAPRKFEFKGQIILITNLKRNKIDPALASRAPLIEVNYNTKQVIASMEKLLKFISPQVPMNLKLEAFNYVKQLYKNDKNITVTFRTIKSIVDARIGNPKHWKESAKIIVGYKGKAIKETKTNSVSYLKVLKESVRKI